MQLKMWKAGVKWFCGCAQHFNVLREISDVIVVCVLFASARQKHILCFGGQVVVESEKHYG